MTTFITRCKYASALFIYVYAVLQLPTPTVVIPEPAAAPASLEDDPDYNQARATTAGMISVFTAFCASC